MRGVPRFLVPILGISAMSGLMSVPASSIVLAQQGSFQQGYSVQQWSGRDPSNFVTPLRTGPNFVRPQRYGAGPNRNDFHFATPASRRSFDFEQQERLWYLQERARYQRERSSLMPDPDYVTPGTRPYSLFHRYQR
jgi:hypothetical protein